MREPSHDDFTLGRASAGALTHVNGGSAARMKGGAQGASAIDRSDHARAAK
jgi:hypothetical protein